MCHQSVEDEAEDIERRWKVESGKWKVENSSSVQQPLHYTLHYAAMGNGLGATSRLDTGQSIFMTSYDASGILLCCCTNSANLLPLLVQLVL
jgi:hypothetical protein